MKYRALKNIPFSNKKIIKISIGISLSNFRKLTKKELFENYNFSDNSVNNVKIYIKLYFLMIYINLFIKKINFFINSKKIKKYFLHIHIIV